jgi:sensor c-di-GMP phosphodiesterase-like protein
LSAAAIVLGLLAGYLIGRKSILFGAEARLGDYADRVLNHEEEVSREVQKNLLAANASPFRVCSDQDIALLRRLTFAARFLKDVGRLEGNEFVCSATVGKLPAPIPLQKPDVRVQEGAGVYRKYPLTIPAGDSGSIITYRNSDAVVGPDLITEFPQHPIRYFVGVALPTRPGSEKNSISTNEEGIVKVPPKALTSHATISFGDSLYQGRCSKQFPICAVTCIRLPELWKSSQTLLYGYTATGGVAGTACAMALLVVGRKRRSHVNQLKRAILNGRLAVAYQPIVELRTHRIVGAEALARWTDEYGESVRPETILALAEAEGFVSEVTRFVLTRSLHELKPLLESDPHFYLSINLAPTDLADPRLLLLLDEQLFGTSITPANIGFELTERATSDRDTAVAAIRRLRQRGHSVFIDDFGTGYSNLAYLNDLCVDGIKINRSFTATIGTESVTASIVPQILAVAKALNLKVVVQGIERPEQARYFADNNDHILGQGWFFGLPTSARNLMYLSAEKTE